MTTNYLVDVEGLEYLIPQIKYSNTYKSSYTPVKPDISGKISWGNIKGDITNQTDLYLIIENLEQRIHDLEPSGSIFKYQGQVAKVENLPTNPNIGDVYDVLETGANYVWNGSNWDKLSENIDLSQYAKTDDIYTKQQLDQLLDLKADVSLIYSKTEIDELLQDKVSVAELNAVAANLDIERQERELADTNLEDMLTTSLSTQDGNIQALVLQVDELKSRIEDLKSLDSEVVVFYDGGDTEYNNPTKDFQLSGLVTSPAVITSNSVTLKEATMTGTYLDLYADQDITIKQSTVDGSVPKASSNAVMKLRANGYITIRDCQLNLEKAYNGIECNLTEALAKSIIIDNIDFNGNLSNNAINVFGMADGGVVTISNCHFKKVSNMIRLSNRLNTTWTVNIINCVCDEWDTTQYPGMMLFENYTSQSQEEAVADRQFSKLTINIQNLTKPDGTKLTMPDDLSTICGTKDSNQIFYVYDQYNKTHSYGEEYPTIHII